MTHSSEVGKKKQPLEFWNSGNHQFFCAVSKITPCGIHTEHI